MAMGDSGNSYSGDKKFKRGMTVIGAAELVYQLTGSNMSSPQTAELNAKARAPTIGKWVTVTQWEAAAWVAFLCWLFGNLWPLVGGTLSWTGMYGKYRYAITAGLQSNEPPTEDYRIDYTGGKHGNRQHVRAR